MDKLLDVGDDEVELSQLWLAYIETNSETEPEWFQTATQITSFTEFATKFIGLFSSLDRKLNDISLKPVDEVILNLTAHLSSICISLSNRLDKATWENGIIAVFNEAGLPQNAPFQYSGPSPHITILLILRLYGTVLQLPQFSPSHLVALNRHKVLGQAMMSLFNKCNELLSLLNPAAPNNLDWRNTQEVLFGQSVYFLMVRIIIGLLPPQPCLGLCSHPWSENTLSSLKLWYLPHSKKESSSDFASLVSLCAPRSSSFFETAIHPSSSGILERSYVVEWMLSNGLMKLLLEPIELLHDTTFLCCVQADVASAIHSSIFHMTQSIGQRSAHEFEVAGGPAAILAVIRRGVGGVTASAECRLASVERFSTCLAALSAWIELGMTLDEVASLSKVLHDLVTQDIPSSVFELIRLVKTLPSPSHETPDVSIACLDGGSLPYEFCSRPAQDSPLLGSGARLLSTVFLAMGAIALSELPMHIPGPSKEADSAAKPETTKKWYEIGSLFSSRPAISESSSNGSMVDDTKHGLLKLVLETLVYFVEFQHGESSEMPVSFAQVPVLEWSVLLTFEKILNTLPMDANVAACEARVWHLLLGVHYLKGGRALEFEPVQNSNSNELSAATTGVDLGWCQLHDRTLLVLHAAALGGGPDSDQSLVYMVARSLDELDEYNSWNLIILRIARWLAALIIPRNILATVDRRESQSLDSTEPTLQVSSLSPRRSNLPPLPTEWTDKAAQDAVAMAARSALQALDFIDNEHCLSGSTIETFLSLLNGIASGQKAEVVCSLVCSRAHGSIDFNWPPVLPRLDLIMTLCVKERSAKNALRLMQTLLLHCAKNQASRNAAKGFRADFAAKRGRAIALRVLERAISSCSTAVNNASNSEGVLSEMSTFEGSQDQRLDTAFTMMRWLRSLLSRGDVNSVAEPLQLLFRQVGIVRTLVSLLFLLADAAQEEGKYQEVRLLALTVLSCCMGCMRNRGPLRVGDRNKESFRIALLHESRGRSEQLRSNHFDISTSVTAISSSSLTFYPLYTLLLRLERGLPSCELLAVLLDMVFDDTVLSEGIIRASPKSKGVVACQGLQGVKEGMMGARTMQHADIIPLLFLLLPWCEESTQTNTLEAFNWFLTADEFMNAPRGHQVACGMVRPSLLTVLLDMFPRLHAGEAQCSAIALMTTLGRHSVTVAQLKRMFRLMNAKEGFRPAYSWRLVKALHEMATDRVGGDGAMLPSPAAADFKRVWRRRGPHRHFLLDGRDSGLKMPLMPRWPASKGYAFSTWFRVEGRSASNESTQSSNRKPYHPYIFSFRCRGGNGVELFLKQGKTLGHFTLALTIHSKARGTLTKDLGMSTVLMEGQWRFVALSHIRSQFRTVSTVDLVIDEHHVSVEMSYPRFDSNVRGFIGRRGGAPFGGPSPSDGEGFGESWPVPVVEPSHSVFRGQMGAVYVFSEAIPVEKLHSLYRLGPNYTYFFERAVTDLRHHDDDSADLMPAMETALDGTLTSLIMLAYNPAVHAGDAFLDNAPEKNAVSWGTFSTSPFNWVGGASSNSSGIGSVFRDMTARPVAGHMHALRLPGTVECVTRDVRNTLDCLGGIKVLFPLFAQFDQPTAELDKDAKAGFETEPKLAEWVLNLLGTLVDRRSAANDSFLHQQRGWPLVTFFLKRVSPQHLTKATLKAMRRLTQCGKWSETASSESVGVTGDVASITFPDSAVGHLLAHWGLWVFADHQVQLLMSEELRDMASKADHQLAVPLQSILDAMVLHFWYSPPISLVEEYDLMYPSEILEENNEKTYPISKKGAATPSDTSEPYVLRMPSSLSRTNSSTQVKETQPSRRASSWSLGVDATLPAPIVAAPDPLSPRRARPSKAAVKRLVKPLLALESFHPSESRKVDGTRAPRNVVKDIRSNLWVALEAQLEHGKLSQQELCALVGFCLRADDDSAREEGLAVMLQLTKKDGQALVMVTALHALSAEQSGSCIGVKGISSGVLLLLELLKATHSSTVRVSALLLMVRALGAIFGFVADDSDEPKTDPSSPLYSLFGGDAPTRRLVLSWASRQLAALSTNVLSKSNEAAAISDGLLEVLVGGDAGALGARWVGGGDIDLDPMLLVQEKVIVPEVLGALCVHLSRKELSSSKRGQLLQQIKDLSSSDENREALLAEPNWQSAILFVACSALKFSERGSDDRSSVSSAGDEIRSSVTDDYVREIRSSEVAVSVVCGLVFHALTSWYRKIEPPPEVPTTPTAATVEVEARIMNINLLAGVEEKAETPVERASPLSSGGELDEVLATLQVLARPSEHRMQNVSLFAENRSISEQQVGGAIAGRVGFQILMGVVQRLQQEMELLASRRGQWFDGGQLNSPAAWDSTVAVVWHTVRSALSFLVMPPDSSANRSRFERVVVSSSFPEPLSEPPASPILVQRKAGDEMSVEDAATPNGTPIAKDVTVTRPSLEQVPTWRVMEAEEDSKEAMANAMTSAWLVVEALVGIVCTVNVADQLQGRETEDSRPTMLAGSSSGEGMATFFSETRHCFLGGLLPRLPSTQDETEVVEAVEVHPKSSIVSNPSPVRRRRRGSSAETFESEEEKAAWLSEKPLYLVEPTHTLIPWAFCRLLLNTAVLGSRSDGDEAGWCEAPPVLSLGAVATAASHIECVESIALSALRKLSQMLTLMQQAKVDGLETEIVLVVSSLVAALRTTVKPQSDPWVGEALELVQRIASNPLYTKDLTDLFTRTTDVVEEESPNHIRMRAASFECSSERVFKVLCSALKVADRAEDWTRWDANVGEELTDAMAEEVDFAALLHAPGQASYESALAEEERRAVRRRSTRSALDQRVSEAAKNVRLDEACRLVEVLAEGERDKKHSEQEWCRILEGLASERGPWGVNHGEGEMDARRVYWMMDDSEDHLRRRQKLSRNPLGSDHAGAAQHNYENQVSELKEPVSRRKTRGNESSLWKDLRRFQKKSDMVAESDSSGEEDEDDEEERANSPKVNKTKRKETKQGEEGDEAAVDSEDNDLSESETVDGEAKLFNEAVELLMRAPLVVTPGILEVTKDRIRFTRIDDEEEEDRSKSGWDRSSINAAAAAEEEGSYQWAVKHVNARTWRTCDVVKLAYRHYSLRFVAMEVFFADHSVVMFNCKTSAMCKKLHDAVSRCKPPYLVPQPDSPRKVLAGTLVQGIGLTEAWVQREITNFEYLMALNTIAGRTYNDLAQYPIFPWVLSDYTSAELDLASPRTFRDLRYPMGIQHGRAREDLQIRYRELESMTEPGDPASAPFHYGACYSNPAFVLWYLLRLEPFTSLHIHLQAGQIDKPDRLFQSLSKAYRGCTNNPTDVKELIPEFFYQPDFLKNGNAFDLGTTQDGNKLGDVELPPWANGDPCEFMRLHRLALESEFVSVNLHHWVDLIFGYKQRPPHMPNGSVEAVKACNVYRFYHYPDAFNMDEVEAADPLTHEVWIKTANEFGQVPVQLFPKRPHPQRIPLHQADIIWPIASVVPGAGTCLHRQPEPQRPKFLLSYPPRRVASCAVILVAELTGGVERLVTMDAERVIGYHVKERRPPDVVPPYKLRIDSQALNLSASIVRGNHVSSRAEPASDTPKSPSRDTESGTGKVIASLSSMGSSSSARERRLAVPFAPLHSSRRVVSEMRPVHQWGTHMSRRRQRNFSREDSSETSEFGAVVSVAMTASDGLEDPIFEEGLNDLNDLGDSERIDSDQFLSEKRSAHSRDDELGPHLFAVLGKFLFSSKHWDCSFKVTHLESGRLVQSVALHHDVLTCLALANEGNRSWLVTASCDCTVMVWEVDGEEAQPVSPTPLHTLTGHDDAVTCVAASPQLDLVVSASQDSLIVHTLFHGTYVRTLDMTQPDPMPEKEFRSQSRDSPSKVQSDSKVVVGNIHWVGISQQGFIITYSLDNMCLCTFSVNGVLLRRQSVGERLHAFMFSEDGKVLLTGGTGRAVVWRWVHDLQLADNDSRIGFDGIVDGSCDQHKVPAFPAPIRSLAMSEHERHLMVGLENGQVYMLAPDSNYLRQRLQKQLEYLGFY